MYHLFLEMFTWDTQDEHLWNIPFHIIHRHTDVMGRAMYFSILSHDVYNIMITFQDGKSLLFIVKIFILNLIIMFE